MFSHPEPVVHAAASQSALLHRLLDRRPRAVPADRLIDLLALEARPHSILVVGDDRAHEAVATAFPAARVDRFDGVTANGPAHTAPSHDAVLCVQGVTRGFASDRALTRCLVDRLLPGGHLALLELAVASELRSALRGVVGHRPLVNELGRSLVPLHHSEESSWLGIWRHLLFVGRKGRVIR